MRRFGWFATTAAVFVLLLSMSSAAQAQRFYVDVDPSDRYYRSGSYQNRYYDRSYRSGYRAYNRPHYSNPGKHKGWYKGNHRGWRNPQIGSHGYRRWH